MLPGLDLTVLDGADAVDFFELDEELTGVQFMPFVVVACASVGGLAELTGATAITVFLDSPKRLGLASLTTPAT